MFKLLSVYEKSPKTTRDSVGLFIAIFSHFANERVEYCDFVQKIAMFWQKKEEANQ